MDHQGREEEVLRQLETAGQAHRSANVPGSSVIPEGTIEDLGPDGESPVASGLNLNNPGDRGKGIADPEESLDPLEKLRREVQEIREAYVRDREESKVREEELEVENVALAAALDRQTEQLQVMRRAAERQQAETSGGERREESSESQRPEAEQATGRRTISLGAELFPPALTRAGAPPAPRHIDEIKEPTPTELALQALAAQVAEMKSQMEERDREATRPLFGARFDERVGPLSHIISEDVRSGTQKSLKLTYCGTGCPLQHLDSFRSQTSSRGYSDAVCCSLFQETLRGEALNWYYELKPGSVSSFRQLRDLFVERFILRVEGDRNSAGLFNCRQTRGEGLKAFVNRWQSAAAGVRNLDKAVAEQAFEQGLLPGKFLYAVRLEQPKGYDELMAMAIKHAQAEDQTFGESNRSHKRPAGEMVEDRKESSSSRRSTGRSYAPGGKVNNDSQYQRQQPRNDQGGARGSQWRPRYNNYNPRVWGPAPRDGKEVFTTLTATYEKILEDNRSVIPEPPARPHPKSHLTQEMTGKYCRYHDEASHATNQCIGLKRTIEKMIKDGKLQQYRAGNREVGVIRTDRNDRINVYGSINMIHGGAKVNNLSNKAKKQCLRGIRSREIYAFGKGSGQAEKTGWESVTFTKDEEPEDMIQPHSDPFLITVQIDHYITGRMLIDTGASVNVMFRDAYKGLKRDKDKLSQDNEPLISFSGEVVQPLGSDYLSLIFIEEERVKKVEMEFIVVDCLSSYNGIIGRPGLWNLKSFIAGHMLMIKIPSPTGIITVRGDQRTARKYYSESVTMGRTRSEVFTTGVVQVKLSDPVVDPRDDTDSDEERPVSGAINEYREFKRVRKEKPAAAEETEEVSVCPRDPERKVVIGTKMGPGIREKLISFLQDHEQVFAWSYQDMPGISTEIAMHRLNVIRGSIPVRQRRRSFSPEKYEAIRREVQRLMDIGFIREVQYPRWLANVVMVPKKGTGQWRMCVDFTNLNRACPKDSFPLPRIDQLVDSTSGYKMLSFMDAYAGYNQIAMSPEDEESTSFTTDRGLYCYKRMPYGLKNAGATFQRVVNKMLEEEMGKTVEVYVDDMLVKSLTAEEHINNLTLVIGKMLKFGMRLNPKKCIFGITEGKFLGHIISQRGIEANPEKVKAIMDMESPKERNQVSILTGRLAALARFISRLTDKCTPFFKVLKSQKFREITWGEEQEVAFLAIKAYLADVPLLSKPSVGEMLYLYLAASTTAVSSALVRKEATLELPVFYTGKGYTGAESRYPDIEKLALALITSARKLRHYFQAHSITVYTNFPLRQILHKPESSGRLMRWAVELGEFDIHYIPRTAIKGQAAADFISELTPMKDQEDQVESMGKGASNEREPAEDRWKLFIDGSVTKQRSGAGAILVSPDGRTHEYSLRFLFKASNNAAEYEALIAGLQLAREVGITAVDIFSDSKLVVNQINGHYGMKEPVMNSYQALAKVLMERLGKVTIQHIPREENRHADALARLATGGYDYGFTRAKIENLERPSIERALSEIFAIEHVSPSWMDPIKRCIQDGIFPEDKKEARRMKSRCARYSIMEGKLYRRGYCFPHLKCVTEQEGEAIMREIHEGVCGNHSGSRSLAFKFLRLGYFWPNIADCSRKISGRCHKCHLYKSIPHAPAIALSIIMAPWPFAQWGMDLIGPFPTAKGQFKYAIVIVDYETKWIEAQPLVKITEENVRNFLWRNLYCRFGVPEVIITDNGAQFNNENLIGWTAGLGTRMVFASVAHPQTNGQVEAINKIIKSLLKKKLDDKKGLWAEELPAVLWAIRTTATEATGETPFALTFGSEAVLPVELKVPTARVENYDASTNSDGLSLNLDLIEEVRDQAHLRNQVYKQRVARYYDKRLRVRTLKVGDWVMKKVQGKVVGLEPSWEGPFQITESVGPVTFHIRSQDGIRSTHPWNIEQLRYYPT